MKSSLKKHCVAGPKSPSRCMSAKLAAIPPAFFQIPSGKAFHLSLTETELNNPLLRISLGKLANDVDSNANTVETSFDDLTHLLHDSNDNTKQCLRRFRSDVYNRRGKQQECAKENSGNCEFTAGGIHDANSTPSAKRTRIVRRRSAKVPYATVVKSHDESQVCENSRTGSICETKSSSVVQPRSKSRNIRRVRQTTTTSKEPTRRNSESKIHATK